MLTPKPCNPYHAVVRSREALRGPDGRSVFKVYLVDIVGRTDRKRTEWSRSDLASASVLETLRTCPGIEGVGFITLFPHVTKVFRFGPEAEIVLNVRGWNTRDLSHMDLTRSDGYVEFACLAEAALAADEYAFWAEAETVEDYVVRWSAWSDGPVRTPDKLQVYWNRPAGPTRPA